MSLMNRGFKMRVDDVARGGSSSLYQVDEIVRLDRLPKSNPLSGLLLLREAWSEAGGLLRITSRPTATWR